MESKLTNSELCTELSTVTSGESDLCKAWHLLSLLLKIGHPARPTELASRCDLFPASAEFVEFLSLVPNSPLLLTEDFFVTLSSVAVFAFGQFVSSSTQISEFVPRISIGLLEQRKLWEDVGNLYCRKRKRNQAESECLPVVKKRLFSQIVDDEEKCQNPLASSDKIQNSSPKVYFQVDMCRRVIKQPDKSWAMSFDLHKSDKMKLTISFRTKSNSGHLSYGPDDVQGSQKEVDVFVNREEFACVNTSDCHFSFCNCIESLKVPGARVVKEIEADVPHPEPSLLPSRLENLLSPGKAMKNRPVSTVGINLNEQYCTEVDEHMIISLANADNMFCASEATVKSGENETVDKVSEEEHLSDSAMHINDFHHLPIFTTNKNMPCEVHFKTSNVRTQVSAEQLSVDKKQLPKPIFSLKPIHKDAQKPKLQVLSDYKTIGDDKDNGVFMEHQHCKRDKRSFSMKQKLKQNFEEKISTEGKRESIKEIRGKPISSFLKNQVEQKSLPNFESFTVEEEEGSGGYGTVYRAKRKHDGKTLAIKCPRNNANRHHIQNELKMLERFGGKNFVIKYEGSFKYGNADCLVLEHVEHDRPEFLKREIDIFQLQWYGYCLFKALACLHKQGVIHRDVKPGNFLFSSKVNKGYLIDFNLAMDLHQKYGSIDKSVTSYCMDFNHVQLPRIKSLPPAKSRKITTCKALEVVNQEAGKVSKSLSLQKNLKKKTIPKEYNCLTIRNGIKSQGADGSGITSAKDATSTRIPSTERLREPVPCQGRKELISLAQEAMQGPSHALASGPASKRKRVAAAPERVDRKLVYVTPMPLHCTGIAVAGAGLLKSNGESKHKREGPCVGTKGFRAPEVLFRSTYQGPKVDVWSAGVTLLYLVTGRSPFVGDPDQNIKDIAKLRGTEDLWEVAKLHNRESSFPVELFDMKHLPTKKLSHWCGLNTRRPEFLEVVPRSFFDLMEKCLTVNPRLRISAEEALRHEFFAPCHEQLRKQRLLRQALSLDTGSSLLSSTQPETCEGLQC